MIKYKNSALPELHRPNQLLANNHKNIDLSTNVPYDKHINVVATDLLNSVSLSQYPDPSASYEAIANFYGVEPATITIGYGATEIIERIFKSIHIPHLFIVQPAFEMVEVYCKIYQVAYTLVERLTDIPNNSFVYISNPNGNTGEIYDVIDLVKRSALVIVDEVYGDFFSEYSVVRKNFKNVIIVKSLSKSLGLAGLRFGFSISSDYIASMLNKTRSNHVITSAAATLVPKLIPYIPEVIARLLQTKQFLELNSLCKTPTFGNYILFLGENTYTQRFGAKKVGNYYRMALVDYHTLTNCSVSHQSSFT